MSDPHRVLVTGATGFIGSQVARALVRRGDKVAILLRPEADTWRIRDVVPRVAVVSGDLRTIAAAAPAIAAFAPRTVIHLAWHGVRGTARDDPDQLALNVGGTLTLLGIANRCGVSTWVGLGSHEEYGDGPAMSETTPPAPRSTYGLAKLACGLIVRELCRFRAIRALWLRLFAAYGPYDDPQRLIPYVITALLRGERPALTEGSQVWDYLYVDDAVDAMLALEGSDLDGVFNVASGEPRDVRSIVELIRDLVDPRLPLGFGELPYRSDEPPRFVADVARLRAALGWRPSVSFAEGIARTIRWYEGRSAVHARRGTGGA